MRDSEDAFLTAYYGTGLDAGTDPVGYPFGMVPEFSNDDIPMAETAYGAGFGDLGRPTGHKPLRRYRRLMEMVESLPMQESKTVRAELDEHPGFVHFLQRFVGVPEGLKRLRRSALRAILNEFDPSQYPGMVGHWKVLRRTVRKVAKDIGAEIMEKVKTMTPRQRFDYAHELLTKAQGVSGFEGMDFWAQLATTVAGAASSIYGAKVQSTAAKDIAKIQAESAARQADLQMKMAQATLAAQQASQVAAQQAGQVPGAPGLPGGRAVPDGTILGIPTVPAIIGGITILGLGIFLLMKK
jgi:hypothetical protein